MPIRVIAVLAVLIAISSCGGCGTQSRDQMVDVGTHRLHIHGEGEGAPTIVIDVGIASSMDEWRSLQRFFAETTRVCLYERSGYGLSEAGPFPRDSGRAADELHSLLVEASVPGPYVLVGHSLGALNLQVYAARYPENVAAMVLLDPPPLGWRSSAGPGPGLRPHQGPA